MAVDVSQYAQNIESEYRPVSGSTGPVDGSDFNFGTVLDAVDDLGMDPTGGRANDSNLVGALSSNTLIQFPDANSNGQTQYLFSEMNEWVGDGLTDVGLQGTGDQKTDVEITFPQGNSGSRDSSNYKWINIQGGNTEGVLIDNLTIQTTGNRRTGCALQVECADRVLIRDVLHDGWKPTASYGPGSCIYINMRSSDGVGELRRVQITGGGVASQYPHRAMGVMSYKSGDSSKSHRGTTYVVDCFIEELGSSGARCTGAPGTMIVKDSFFKNIDNTSVRVGGTSSDVSQTVVKNCGFVQNPNNTKYNTQSQYNTVECVRFDASNNDGGRTAVFKDSDVAILSRDDQFDGVVKQGFGQNSCRVENVSMASSTGGCMIYGESPQDSFEVLNTKIYTEANSLFSRDGVLDFNSGWNNLTVKDSCIEAPNFSGYAISAGDPIDILNTTVNLLGDLVDVGSATLSGIVWDQSCDISVGSSGGSDGGNGGESGTDVSDITTGKAIAGGVIVGIAYKGAKKVLENNG